MAEPRSSADRTIDRAPEARLTRPSNVGNDNRFRIDFSKLPRGYTAEWKRHKLFGQEDKRNIAMCEMYHWKAVPAKLQPHLLGPSATQKNPDGQIEIDGLVLYMRPDYLVDEANTERQRTSDYQIQQQLTALRLSSQQQVGARFTKIKRTVVPAPQEVE